MREIKNESGKTAFPFCKTPDPGNKTLHSTDESFVANLDGFVAQTHRLEWINEAGIETRQIFGEINCIL